MNSTRKLNSAFIPLWLAGFLILAISAPKIWAVGTTNILQWSFPSTSGNVTVPVPDTSGYSPSHPGSNLILNSGSLNFSSDIPTNTQYCTGVGSVNFSGVSTAISTAASENQGSGQGIFTGAQVVAAGGITLEAWVKNPSKSGGLSLNVGGYMGLGVTASGDVCVISADNDASATLHASVPSGQWTHLAMVAANPTSSSVPTFGTVRFYLNGQLVNALSNFTFYNSYLDRAVSVGNHQYANWNDYDGLVYEPRVMLGALPPEQFTCKPGTPPSGSGTTNVLQWSFTNTSGNVTVPIADTSGFSPAHPAVALINGGQPTYSPDIPTNHTQFCTGIGSVNFSGIGAGLSTTNSIGVASGQGMLSAAQVYAAGGITLEVWVKNPSMLANGSDSFGNALLVNGMYGLGVDNQGRVGFGDPTGFSIKTTTPPAPGQWLHLAAVMANPNATCTTFSTSVYVNGILIGSGVSGNSSFLDRATCVGSWQYGYNNLYQGLIYEPRVTLGALNTNQFTTIPHPVQLLDLSFNSVSNANGNPVFTWNNPNAILESAPTLLGPWTPVAAEGLTFWMWTNSILKSAPTWSGSWTPVAQPTSPYTYTNRLSDSTRFFHLRLPPKAGDADFPDSAASSNSRHYSKVALIRSTNVYPLVLIGDSITQTLGELPENPAYNPNTAVWNKHFAPRNAINLGMNGYRTGGIIWDLQNGELDFTTSPKVFMILIGCNNADDRNFPTSHTPQQILAGTKAIVDLIRMRHPTSKILVLRIFPRGGDNQATQATAPWPPFAASLNTMMTCFYAGQLTSLLADNEHVFWLDINSVFLQPGPTEPPDWLVRTDLLWDLLHPSAPLGSETWCEAVEPTLSELMGDNPL